MLNKKEKQTESIALFKGFTNEQLELLEGKNVKKIAEQSHEVYDMQQED